MGKRRSDRDLGTDEGVVGLLTMNSVSSYRVASICEYGDSRMAPILPELYDPVVTGIQGGKLLLRGYQIGVSNDVGSYLQEWVIEPLGVYRGRWMER